MADAGSLQDVKLAMIDFSEVDFVGAGDGIRK